MQNTYELTTDKKVLIITNTAGVQRSVIVSTLAPRKEALGRQKARAIEQYDKQIADVEEMLAAVEAQS